METQFNTLPVSFRLNDNKDYTGSIDAEEAKLLLGYGMHHKAFVDLIQEAELRFFNNPFEMIKYDCKHGDGNISISFYDEELEREMNEIYFKNREYEIANRTDF